MSIFVVLGVECVEGLGEWLEWFLDGDGVYGFSVCGVFALGGLGWVGVVDDGGVEGLGVYGEEECFLGGEVLVFVESEVYVVGSVPVLGVVVDGF